MKKLIMIVAVAAAVSVFADIWLDGPVRNMESPDMKVVMVMDDHHNWRISEDVPLFAAQFAVVCRPESLLNYAEQKELAKRVAKTVAAFIGSTNAVRVAHWERPEPASTNVVDVLMSQLSAKLVTDELIQNDFHARCMEKNTKKKDGTK